MSERTSLVNLASENESILGRTCNQYVHSRLLYIMIFTEYHHLSTQQGEVINVCVNVCVNLLESQCPARPSVRPSQKLPHGDTLGTKRGIIDQLVSKRQEKLLKKKEKKITKVRRKKEKK